MASTLAFIRGSTDATNLDHARDRRSAPFDTGLQRYGTAVQSLLAHPRLADPATVVRRFAVMQRFPDDRLREGVRGYLAAVRVRCAEDASCSDRGEVERLTADSGYLQRLSHDELVSIANLEYFKGLLGKLRLTDLPGLCVISSMR